MIAKLVATMAVITILLDWYIIKRISICGKKWIKRLYIFSVALVYLLIIIALASYKSFSNADSHAYMQLILWVILLFFLSVVPKLVYAIFSFLDYLVQWVRHRHSGIFKRIGIICAFLVLGVMIWGATGGRNRIVVKEVTLESNKLPADFDGYKIAFFSDLHIGNLPTKSTLAERMVAKINSLNPDIVVNGGDLVNMDARELNTKYQTILSGIKSSDGVYAVIGNHDLGIYMHEPDITVEQNIQMLEDKYKSMGWNLLLNDTRYIKRNNDSISISGIKYPKDTRLNANVDGFGADNLDKTYEGVPDSTYNIMISHTPQKWNDILRYGISDLTLSGHVHAMQMKFGFGKNKWSPAEWMYERWSGLYNEGDKYLYINDGMGYVMFPMRISAYPEITLITLKKQFK